MISRIWNSKPRDGVQTGTIRRQRRHRRRQRASLEVLEPRSMLAVTLLTPVTPGFGGHFDAGGNSLVWDAGTAADTNTFNITLTDTSLTGFGSTVLATFTVNSVTTTYYNYNNAIDFQGWTADTTNVQDNQVTLSSPYGVDLTGDTTGGSALLWTLDADFTPSLFSPFAAGSTVTIRLDGADSLDVLTGAGPSVIAGKIDSPTSTPGKANAEISYTTNGVVTIDGTNIYGGVDTYDLKIQGVPGSTTSKIVLNGTIDVQNDVTLSDGNTVTIDQAVTAGNALTIAGTAGGIGGDVVVNAPLTSSGGAVSVTANTTIAADAVITAAKSTVTLLASAVGLAIGPALTVNDDIIANGAIALSGVTGITTASKADITSATAAVTGTSVNGTIAVNGTITALTNAVTLTAALDVITTGAIAAFTSVAATAGGNVDIGDAVTVTGATAGAGVIAMTAKAGDVVINTSSPLSVADGKIDLTATAGTIDVEAAVASNLAVTLTAGQGITLSNATDPTAGIFTTGINGTITITNGANQILIDAPVAATGDAVTVTCTTGDIDVKKDVIGFGNVTFKGDGPVAIGGKTSLITLASLAGTLSATSTKDAVTLNTNLTLALPAATSNLSLTAGTLVTVPIAVTAGGSVAITSPNGYTVSQPMKSLGSTITITSTGGSVVSTALTAALVAKGDITLSGGTGVSVDQTVKSTDGGVSLTSVGGPVTIAATTLLTAPDTVNGKVTVNAGGALTLGIDLVVGNTITLTTGAAFTPTTNFTSAGGGVSISAGGLGGLNVTASTITALTDVSLAAPAGKLKIDMSQLFLGGDLTLLDATGQTVIGPLTLPGSLFVTTGTAWTPGGDIATTGGSITVTAAGAIGLTGVSLAAPAGSISLTSTAADITVGPPTKPITVDPVTGSITLNAATSVTIAQPLTAGDTVSITSVAPFAPGAANPLTALNGDVTLTASGGVTIDSLVTAFVGDVNATSAAGSVLITNKVVAGTDISATSASTSLTAGVGVGADLTAGGTISLAATMVVGDATLANTITNLITADVLVATATLGVASLIFANTANDVNSLSIVLPSGVDVEFTDVDDLTVTAISTTTGSVTLDAGGFLAVTGAIGSPTTVTGIDLTAVGSITVGAGGSLQVGLPDPGSGVGDIAVTSTGGDVIIEGSVDAFVGSIDISSGGGMTGARIGTTGSATAMFALNDISVTANTGVAVLGLAAPAILAVAGDITLTSGAGVTVEPSITATAGAIDISAGGAGVISLTGTTILAGGGDVTITGTTGAITTSASISAPANSIDISTLGLVTFTGGALGTALTYTAGPPAVGLVSIQGALGVTVTTSPTITCGRLEIGSGSGLPMSFTAAGNNVDTLEVFTKGNFTFSQTLVPLTIRDPDAGGVRSIQVQSTGGSISISSTAGLRIVDGLSWGAGTLSLSAGGPGVEFVPTSTGDNVAPNTPFDGTLRDMLFYVNSNAATAAGGNAAMQVVFNEPASPVALGGTITLGTAPLPAITKRITFDGSLPLAPGGIGGNVYLNGSASTPPTSNGLTLNAGSGGSVIRDTGIYGFKNAAIEVNTGTNVFQGLVLGLDRANAVPATRNGWGIRIAGTIAAPAAGNVIGIQAAGDIGNTIVASNNDGVFIGANAPSTGIYGNQIGVSGTTKLGNAGHGISVQSSIGTVIGSTTALLANAISNNGKDGVFVTDVTGSSTAYGAQVVGNTIASNTEAGVRIRGGAYNLVGGTVVTAGNAISGSRLGIALVPTTSTAPTIRNTILRNTVSGMSEDGIRAERSSLNLIVANEVTNNAKSGILLDNAPRGAGFALANRVYGNSVNANGDAETNGGIVLVNSANQIIGQPGGPNTLTGNTGSGIVISGTLATGNSVTDNVVVGRGPGNGGFHGIVVSAGTGNTIRRNTVSGHADNGGAGVAVIDSIAPTAAVQNTVAANTASGNQFGVLVRGGRFVTVGGTLTTDTNFVFSNNSHGIYVVSSTVSGPAESAAIRNNRVGVNGSAAAGNGGFGIRIEGGSGTVVDFANLVRNNTLGGVGVQGGDKTMIGSPIANRGNTISGNTGSGVVVEEPALSGQTRNVTVAGNVIQGNGYTNGIANGGSGITVSGVRTSDVVIGRQAAVPQPNGTGNAITGNGGGGITVTGSQRVTIIGNSIGSNAGAPIVRAGLPNPPTITSVSRRGNQFDIRGRVTGTAGQRFYVDLYMDVTGGGQGYMGRVLVTIARGTVGTFRVLLNGPAGGLGGGFIRATSTVATGGTLVGDTSAFSA